MKNFFSVHDVNNIDELVENALAYKQHPLKDRQLGEGKRIGLLFLNPSLRTRLSTQIAARNLGMEPIVFNMDKEGWALEFEDGAVMNGTTVEHIKDAAPVLGQYFDVLCLRTFPGLENREEDYSEKVFRNLMQYAGLPLVSMESATLHPLQSLADLITIKERFSDNRKPKVVLTWAPHVKALPQAVSNSFAQWVNAWDKADFVITQPEGFELKEEFTKGATILHNQAEALADADFVYIKNWSSYRDYGKVKNNADDWMLSSEKLKGTCRAKVMHCLPVRRNVELSDAVLDSAESLVNWQAGNRVWAAQAVIAEILKNQS